MLRWHFPPAHDVPQGQIHQLGHRLVARKMAPTLQHFPQFHEDNFNDNKVPFNNIIPDFDIKSGNGGVVAIRFAESFLIYEDYAFDGSYMGSDAMLRRTRLVERNECGKSSVIPWPYAALGDGDSAARFPYPGLPNLRHPAFYN
jgi:hypothetical protein